jgi:hypothetical protein
MRTVRQECLDHVLIYGPSAPRARAPGVRRSLPRGQTTSGTRLGPTGRQPNTAGPGDYPNAGRTRRRARPSDSQVSPGGVIRIVEPLRDRPFSTRSRPADCGTVITSTGWPDSRATQRAADISLVLAFVGPPAVVRPDREPIVPPSSHVTLVRAITRFRALP